VTKPPLPSPPQPQPKTWRDEARSWAKAIATAVVIWIFLRSYIIEAFRIPSGSMENTLLVGDFLFVNKAAYGGALEIPFIGWRFLHVPGYSDPRHDGVVIFRSVEDSTPNLDIVKRVMGEPGDTLQMIHDTLIRNGRRLDEPYALHGIGGGVAETPHQLADIRARQLPQYVGLHPEAYHPTTHDWGPVVVPPKHYWVMGDNRDDSYDSRIWGFLPRSHVEGRPLFIYFSVDTDPFRIRWNRLFKVPR
jgi:signal peptidase I